MKSAIAVYSGDTAYTIPEQDDPNIPVILPPCSGRFISTKMQKRPVVKMLLKLFNCESELLSFLLI